MNHLDYAISLRAKGLSKNEIKEKLLENGVATNELDFYLKKSDEVFLTQALNNKKNVYQEHGKGKSSLKIIVLVLSFVLLSFVFFGYARLGLIWLFILWSIIGLSSFRK